MRLITLLIIGFICLALFIGTFPLKAQTATSDPASKFGLIPHKALYEIDLASTKSGSQIVNVDGQMMFEWQPGCEGWTSNHRFKLLYEYADSPPLNIVSDFSTYESYDGKSFNFSSQRKRDGQVFEEFRGASDKKIAQYSIPEGLSYDLKENTYFPVGHTIATVKAMKENKRFYTAHLFDGSDENGPVQVNAFIGKPVNGMARLEGSADLDTTLLNNPAKKIRLAFFPLNSGEPTADYEMDMIFHENGVISDMLIEYKDFSIKQKLVALEVLPSTCEAGGQ